MIRESTSRPSESVPSRWLDDGCASSALKSVALGEYGANCGAKAAMNDEYEHHHEPGDRRRAAQEPLPEQPPASLARIDDGGCVLRDRAHVTRIRGFSSEYTTSTSRLMITYPAAATSTTPWISV